MRGPPSLPVCSTAFSLGCMCGSAALQASSLTRISLPSSRITSRANSSDSCPFVSRPRLSPGFDGTAFNSFADISDGTSIVTGLTDGAQDNGALADLYLGASAHLAPRIIAGVQVEGSLAQMVFRSRVRGEDISNQSTRTNTYQHTAPEGQVFTDIGITQESGTETNRFDGINEVELDWMVSVIGRAGFLATPTTYLYGLAGWSYGHFEVNELTFGWNKLNDFESDGMTVGGGIEKMLTPKWSLRGEYRYTNVGNENFSTRTRFASSDPESAIEQGSSFGDGTSSTSIETDVSRVQRYRNYNFKRQLR